MLNFVKPSKLAITHFALLTLGLTAGIKPAFADGNATHLSRSVALPHRINIMRSIGVNNYFEFHIHSQALAALSIELPSQVRVDGEVIVTDESGSIVESNFAVDGDKVNIVFSHPIEPEQTIQVKLNKVKSRGFSSQVFLYPISVKNSDFDIEIPLGTARTSIYE
jgi:hypothetical protein